MQNVLDNYGCGAIATNMLLTWPMLVEFQSPVHHSKLYSSVDGGQIKHAIPAMFGVIHVKLYIKALMTHIEMLV